MSWIKKYSAHRWAIGFVRGGIDAVMGNGPLRVDWVRMPEERWYADPFILDVTDTEIRLLVEDYAYSTRKGVISLLHIDRVSLQITSRKVLLELPTHLSFPAILRRNRRIFIYPESSKSGKLTLYEYFPDTETLSQEGITICDEYIWDSVMTDDFGMPMLFTAAHDDYRLDIYRWDEAISRYVPYQSVVSDKPNSRMGGALFEYQGKYYYPAQDCSRLYGGALDIKRIDYKNGRFTTTAVKHLTSPHPAYPIGIHTLNEYEGVVVIDVKGYCYGWIGSLIAGLVKIKKLLIKK